MSDSAAIPLDLSQSDAVNLNAILDSGENYFKAYAILLQYVPTDSDQYFWLNQAYLINQQANGLDIDTVGDQSPAFIISYSSYGLLLDGKPLLVNATSNVIAEQVILSTLASGAFPSMQDILNNDVSAAVTAGGQTPAGWAGAFYYWDKNFGDITGNMTLGEYILSDPVEYEKFLLSATYAIYTVITQEVRQFQESGGWDTLLTEALQYFEVGGSAALPAAVREALQIIEVGGSAAIPAAVRNEILARVQSALRSDGDIIGGADSIDGWFFNEDTGQWETIVTDNVTGNHTVLVAGDDLTNELNLRLGYRLKVEAQGLDVYENASNILDPYVFDGKVDDTSPCFIAGTLIDMWDGSQKPIETIEAGDHVTSYDSNGNLVAGRVTRVFRKHAQCVLDFFGTGITPSHATLCGDGEFEGRHVPIIDILRSDGAVVRKDETLVRAGTGAEVGTPNDAMIWAITGDKMGGATRVRDKGQIRLGTRFITNDGQDLCVADLIAASGGTVTPDGLIQRGASGPAMPFRWDFTEMLPKPEDYILQRSNLKLSDIYGAAEWEGIGPQMTPPDGEDGTANDDRVAEYVLETELGRNKVVHRSERALPN